MFNFLNVCEHYNLVKFGHCEVPATDIKQIFRNPQTNKHSLSIQNKFLIHLFEHWSGAIYLFCINDVLCEFDGKY